MKTASGIAIAAAAGLFASSAMAADLGIGGNCCADLEERVAELEATTARKGNRVVSLTVYGRITEGILWHDDDDGYREGKLTVRDDGASPTMFGFRGEAQIRPDLTAGYNIEFGVSADAGTAAAGSQGGSGDWISIRHNYVYLDSQTFGRISLGQTSQVTDGLYEINLANTVIVPGDLNEGGSVLNPVLTTPWVYNFDGERRQGVYYRTPSFAGFMLSAGYSHESRSVASTEVSPFEANDYWEVALRYAGEFNGVRIAAGIGYRHEDYRWNAPVPYQDDEADVWLGSGSIMHMPTGLFVSGGLAQADFDASGKQTGFWVMAGIEKNFFGPGTTTLFGEYSEHNYNDVAEAAFQTGDGSFWGLGVVQRIDAAATDLFLKYRNVEVNDADPDAVDSANIVIGGMRIQF
jgi:predicted porin